MRLVDDTQIVVREIIEQHGGPFARLVSATPCLIIERANGQVVYRESGPQLARDIGGLRCAVQRRGIEDERD